MIPSSGTRFTSRIGQIEWEQLCRTLFILFWKYKFSYLSKMVFNMSSTTFAKFFYKTKSKIRLFIMSPLIVAIVLLSEVNTNPMEILVNDPLFIIRLHSIFIQLLLYISNLLSHVLYKFTVPRFLLVILFVFINVLITFTRRCFLLINLGKTQL